MTAALALLRRFWYVLPIVGLLIWALLMRNDLTEKKAKLDAAQARVNDVTTANQSLNAQMSQIRLQRIDNDTIALKVAAAIDKNKIVETHTQTIIEKAVAHDPVTKSWADSPLPSSVRDALHADQDNAPAG